MGLLSHGYKATCQMACADVNFPFRLLDKLLPALVTSRSIGYLLPSLTHR